MKHNFKMTKTHRKGESKEKIEPGPGVPVMWVIPIGSDGYDLGVRAVALVDQQLLKWWLVAPPVMLSIACDELSILFDDCWYLITVRINSTDREEHVLNPVLPCQELTAMDVWLSRILYEVPP